MSRSANQLIGRHKLDTDHDNGDYRFSNWDALKFCLAVVSPDCVTISRYRNTYSPPIGLPDLGSLSVRHHSTLF
jgi:hypothetical protein